MNHLRTYLSIRCAVLALACTVSLLAAAPLAAQSKPFSVHDSNQDGYLERGEYAEFLSRFWARRAEGRARGFGPPPLAFDQIDLDGDGRISEQEMGEALERRRQHRRWRRWQRE